MTTTTATKATSIANTMTTTLGELLAQTVPPLGYELVDWESSPKGRMVRVAEYSRDCLKALRAETGIAYEGRTFGTTQVFRKAAQMASLDRDTRVLAAMGIDFEVLDPAGVRAAEPGLDVDGAGIVGALRLPGDETGDCNLFTQALAARARPVDQPLS